MRKPSRILPAALVAFVLVINSSLRLLAQATPANVTNISLGLAYGASVSGHYVYVATSGGLRIFDISNPANPVDAGYNDSDGPALAVAVSSQYRYASHLAGVTILDGANPANPVAVGIIAGSWPYVKVLDHFIYLFGGGGVTVYDVVDPANPVKIGGVGASCGYSGAVSGNYAYIASCYSGLLVYDLSDPANFRNVGQGTGRNLAFGVDVALAGNFAYLASYTNALEIYNISSPTNPVIVSSPGAYGNSVALSGNYAYVAGSGGAVGYPANLFVVDVSNPTNASVVAHSPLYGFGDFYAQAHRLEVSGNHAYLATDNGLSVYALGVSAPPPLAITNASANILLLYWPTPTSAFAVQQNPDLNPAHWTTLTNTSMVIGSQNQITVPKPQGTMFYRLVSQ